MNDSNQRNIGLKTYENNFNKEKGGSFICSSHNGENYDDDEEKEGEHDQDKRARRSRSNGNYMYTSIHANT